MPKFRKKPVEVEAIQYNGSNWNDIVAFCGKAERTITEDVIQTLEGAMRVSKGDWIIKGVAGEFYPCKPYIFAATYDAV